MSFSIACKGCGNIVTVPTPQDKVKVVCQACGARDWRVPATPEDIAKFEAAQVRATRAIELARTLNIDGLLKVPEEIRASAEVKNALSNLFAPLEGETLKQAQSNALRVARSGAAVEAQVWIEMYDRAVAKAVKDTAKAPKVSA